MKLAGLIDCRQLPASWNLSGLTLKASNLSDGQNCGVLGEQKGAIRSCPLFSISIPVVEVDPHAIGGLLKLSTLWQKHEVAKKVERRQ